MRYYEYTSISLNTKSLSALMNTDIQNLIQELFDQIESVEKELHDVRKENVKLNSQLNTMENQLRELEDPMDCVITYVPDDKRVTFVKLLRELNSDMGLKEAKELMEELTDSPVGSSLPNKPFNYPCTMTKQQRNFCDEHGIEWHEEDDLF
jgi:ribosomal protein L7/L12